MCADSKRMLHQEILTTPEHLSLFSGFYVRVHLYVTKKCIVMADLSYRSLTGIYCYFDQNTDSVRAFRPVFCDNFICVFLNIFIWRN